MVKPGRVTLGGYPRRPSESNTTGCQSPGEPRNSLRRPAGTCSFRPLAENTTIPFVWVPCFHRVSVCTECHLPFDVVSIVIRAPGVVDRPHVCGPCTTIAPHAGRGILVLIVRVKACGVRTWIVVVFFFYFYSI